MDIQGAIIDIEQQEKFIQEKNTNAKFSIERVKNIIEQSQKPVILVGSGVRTSGSIKDFKYFVEKFKIPVIASTSNADIYSKDYKYYFGNFGVFGGRTGNFILQNADCIIVIGCRLSFKQIGFDYENFASKAKKIVIDIDLNELKKKTIHIDVPIHCDIGEFLNQINKIEINVNMHKDWLKYCNKLKEKYPIYLEKFSTSTSVNPYHFFYKMQQAIDKNEIMVVGNSCACVCLLQSGIAHENQRLWGNVNCGTMGYDLPASIGASISAKREVICVTGDGSIQMNLQELQTIVGNKLPVKIIIFNNEGYNAIVQSQLNFFGRLSGCTAKSGVTFPSFKRIAYAYNIPYYFCGNHDDIDLILQQFLSESLYAMLEVKEDKDQGIEPKSKSKILPSGKIVSPPIYDLAPFLCEEELDLYADFEKDNWKRDL